MRRRSRKHLAAVLFCGGMAVLGRVAVIAGAGVQISCGAAILHCRTRRMVRLEPLYVASWVVVLAGEALLLIPLLPQPLV